MRRRSHFCDLEPAILVLRVVVRSGGDARVAVIEWLLLVDASGESALIVEALVGPGERLGLHITA